MSKVHKEALFTIIIICDFLYGASFGCIFGFFTPIASKYNLTNTEIGLIVTASGIGGIVSGFLYQPLLKRANKEHIWLASLLLFSSATALFGGMVLVPFLVQTPLAFFTTGILLKFLTGFARSGIYNFGISFVSEAFPGGKRMVLLFGMMVAGLTFGPLIGSTFYDILGYPAPFFAIAICTVGSAAIGFYLSPSYPKELQHSLAKRAHHGETSHKGQFAQNAFAQEQALSKDKEEAKFNEKASEEFKEDPKSHKRGKTRGEESHDFGKEIKEVPVTNRMLLKDFQILTILSTCLMTVILQQYLTTGFSVYIYQNFDVPLSQIPHYFNLAGTFRIGVTILNFFLLSHLTHRFLYIAETFAIFFVGLAILFFNSFLKEEKSLFLAFFGYCIVNLAAQATPFALQLILTKIKTNFLVEINHAIRDKVSNILTTVIFMGMVIAPLIYSFLEAFANFEVGMTCCSIAVLFNFVLFIAGSEFKRPSKPLNTSNPQKQIKE